MQTMFLTQATELLYNMENKITSERLSNFELLRIVAMLMIIEHHFCGHGIILNGWDTNLTTLNHINNFILQFFNFGGRIGVDIFLLITGYFLIDGKLKVESFMKIYLMSFFYSAVLVSFYCFHGIQVIPHHITRYLNPLNIQSYWFISVYLIMYLFLPFINPILKNLTKNKYLLLIGMCIILWSFMLQQYNQLVWFITMYAIGGYIKRFNPALLSQKKCFIYGGIALSILSLWILHSLFRNPIHIKILDINNFFIFVLAISIFGIFKDLKIKSNKIINSIAVSVFPIYLIHDNFTVREYLWHKFLPTIQYVSSPNFIFYVIFIPIIVFTVCLVMDKIFAKFYNPVINFINTKLKLLIQKTGLFNE